MKEDAGTSREARALALLKEALPKINRVTYGCLYWPPNYPGVIPVCDCIMCRIKALLAESPSDAPLAPIAEESPP